VRRSRRVLLVALAVLVLVVGVGLLVRGAGQPADPRAAARTSFPDLEPGGDEPTLPALATLSPAPGAVVQGAGPFDDRFRLERLAFDGAAVTGTVTVTSDVSELLELEVLAGFYDRDGALVGTAREVHHLDESTADPAHEGPPDETYRFRIRVPSDADGVVAAAVGVPVLVNE
jgi:hypothetical protein